MSGSSDVAAHRIRFVDAESVDYVTTLEHIRLSTQVPADVVARISPEEEVRLAAIEIGIYFPGSETDLQLFEIRCAPNTPIYPHAHLEDEIVYVLEGTLHFGRRMVGPGSAVGVTGLTTYGFTAGPQGCRFLNFRSRIDFSSFTPEAAAEERARRGVPAPAESGHAQPADTATSIHARSEATRE